MAGKRESLRSGQIVELEPGIQGRLNFHDQTLELSDGRKLAISENEKRLLFPTNESDKKHAIQIEEIEQNIKKTPFGEFFHQIGQQGPLGGIKDIGDKLTHTGDEYLRLKRAEKEIGERISQESPWTSRAATAASLAGDVLSTKGMSAAKAAPLLTGLASGARILEEPLQVGAEAALASAGGKLIDIGTNKLSQIAARRGASRTIGREQEKIRAQNSLSENEIIAKNAEQKQSFNALKERINNENEALLHQHNLDLNDRQNKMIQAKNAFEKAKADREAEIFRLENEYKTAKAERNANAARLENEYKQAKSAADQENKRLNEEYKIAQKKYQDSLDELPRMQREAQEEYSRNVLKNADEIKKYFPKDARIMGKQIDVEGFIDDVINKSAMAGSREANQSIRLLKSLFPEDEFITAVDLAKRYKSIEEAIQRASPEVQQILSEFKNHLGQKLPTVLEDTIAYSKIIPSLSNKIEKEVNSILKGISFGKGEETTRNLLLKTAQSNIKKIFSEIGPNNFIKKLQNGEISQILKNEILTAEDFLSDSGFSNFAKLRKEGMYDLASKALNEKHAFFVNEMDRRLNNLVAKNEIKAMQAGNEASKKLGRSIKKTYGTAQPLEAPTAPIEAGRIPYPSEPLPPSPISPPNLPGPINPLIEPPMPIKPTLRSEPTSPTPISFLAQPEPTLSPPQNFTERSADFLEKPLFKGKGTANNLLKLGALKYALGPSALPIEGGTLAAYAGAKALTSPGVVGDVSRLSFKQSGIQAIEALAQKYPSYQNGILLDPQERRSLTKEIEDDAEIPLEQKALLQSKVNRGKPLGERLQ